MNYYEHHIGDYAEATAHLSFVEDAAYSRLIRKYYATEKPIPADLKAAQRLVAARTREEREAVQRVLEEFFSASDDGWHHHRCDREISAYRAGEPQREAKKRNEDTRLARHRAERAELFAIINDAGKHLPWNAPISEVRALAERIRSADSATPETQPATPTETQAVSPATDSATPTATAPATPATATHTHAPLPTPHSPLPTSHFPIHGEDTRTAQSADAPPDEQPGQRVSKEAAAVMAMKAEGMSGCNPGNLLLTELLQQGAEVQNFASAARTAVDAGKGFAYALGIVKSQLAEARKLAADGRAAAHNGRGRHRGFSEIDYEEGVTNGVPDA